jgi:hypothetical protein
MRERRLVPHMLPMTACQVGHPISVFILMIPDDRLLHAVPITSQNDMGEISKSNVSQMTTPTVDRPRNKSTVGLRFDQNFR